jgi:TorA maturation chaperone TorD
MVQHQHRITDEDGQQYRVLAEQRSKIYWLLSAFFLDAPTADGLLELRSQLSARPREPDDDIDPLLDEFQSVLGPEPDLSELARELCVEYTRLFHANKQGLGLAPPYESVYRESRLPGETTKAVVDAYADAGYEDIHGPAGPQDHLGVELRFLSMLCFDESRNWSGGEVDAARSSWTRQSDFLTRHILAWIPAYCDALERESTARYYEIVAQLTRHAIDHDKQVLRTLITQSCRN